MAPDSIDADPQSLPRAFRGYNRRATEELFRRVAWDYAVLAGEHRKLKTAADHPPAAVEQSPRSAQTQRAELDEEAHRLLGAAQKAARDLRESTRAECELALKKANRRAGEIEEEAFRASGDARAVLEAAAALRLTLEDALRTLEREASASGTNGAVVALPNSALANTARPEPL
jgi:cell division septum initiation protein DivIVA